MKITNNILKEDERENLDSHGMNSDVLTQEMTLS